MVEVVDKGGHFCAAVKGNYPILFADFKDCEHRKTLNLVSKVEMSVGDGTRRASVNYHPPEQQQKYVWTGIRAVGIYTVDRPEGRKR